MADLFNSTTVGTLVAGIALGYAVNSLFGASARFGGREAAIQLKTEREKRRKKGEYLGEHKMVLVIRTDLGMGKGKIVAQCCHGCMANYSWCLDHASQALESWERYGQAKITLKAPGDENSLYDLERKARAIGLPATVIHDAGHTQIASGTATVVCIGPGAVADVNEITGHLKLY
eukprot:Clim_evm47s246 gene=Clim_evmTU47s246